VQLAPLELLNEFQILL